MMPMHYALLLPGESYVEKRTLVVVQLRDHLGAGGCSTEVVWLVLSSSTFFSSSAWSMWISLWALSFGRRACISVRL